MKNSKLWLILLLGLVSSQMAFSQVALKRANKQYELSVFAEAIESYKEVLSKNPDHREANVKIADCYRLTNQLENALPHYQTALANGGIEAIYVFQYGLTLQGLGRYELAKSVFEKLGANDPKFATRGKHFAEACDFAMLPQDPPRYKVTNEYLNKASSDFGPAFFKTDKVVYSSTRTDVSTRNSRNAPTTNTLGANKLLVTQRDRNGFLESPVALHAGFGTATNEGPVSYSKDGKWVAFTKNNFTEGVRQIPSAGLELTLYIAQVNENGDWTNANPFPHNGVGFSTGYPCFSPDGKALFFASDRPGGYGGFDLYVSYQVGNTWSSPENLGVTVNSLGSEITPFYDGLSLYFASDFHKGFGGFDIFRAEESNNRWATLYHGGQGLNSSYDDYGFVFDALNSIGYFVSNRPGGKGLEDIYKAEKETDNVVIKVLDEATSAPIADAIIDFSECDEETYKTNVNGVFNFQMLEDLNCTVYIKKDGYLSEPLKLTSMGLRQSRTLEVKLTNYANAYQGKTVNGSNGYYLDNVKIIANDQKTGDVSTTLSDAQGGYAISLKPNASFLLRFSKPGFQDVTLNVKTTANDNRILRNVDLLPVGTTGKITTTNDPIFVAEPTPPSSASKISTSTNTPTSASTNAGMEAKNIAVSGYSIQVASVKGELSDIRPFQNKLGDLGTVYSVKEDGRSKVRVGIIEDRDDALALQKLVRAKGYDGAFLVSEVNRLIPSKERPAASSTSAPTSYESEVGSVADLKGTMIRLAAFSNMDYFDKGMVDDLGTLTYVPKGNFTIVLLRGYPTTDDALIALRKVKVRGFPDAHLVEYQNGEMKKLN
ncbi:MAG: carboxypeptidase regulatory-like domain-containing protein [Saprospiraceae bacterium]